MSRQITLIRRLDGSESEPVRLESGYVVRRATPEQTAALGRLYFAAYDAGLASGSVEEAIDDIRASFAGDYGRLLASASSVVWRGDEPVAALLTVARAPWEDTPDAPFIIELFTARDQRRRGLARHLLQRTMAILAADGSPAVALRVTSSNVAARALYASLGFVEWRPNVP